MESSVPILVPRGTTIFSFYLLEGCSFPFMWVVKQCYVKQWNGNSGLSYRRTLQEVDRILKNSLLGFKDFRDFL